MSLPELSIRRPVMTTLITLSFIIFGIFAYKQLPVAALPRVDYPTISVSAQLPGASPETMANSVAAVLERQFATISGITSMTSVSRQGSTNVTMQFDLNRNIDGAALDVQTAISATARRLPAELPSPPTFRKVNPADQPVLFLVVTSSTLPLSQVNEFAESILQQQISQLNGVAQVQIFGAQKYAVRIMLDPDSISARNLSFNDVRSAVSATNSNAPVGVLRGDQRKITLEATGQLERAKDYGNVIVTTRNNTPVKLEDIAKIIDSVEDDQTAGWFNNERSIVLAVFRQSDANTVETVDLIKDKIADYRAQMPPGISLHVLNDRSIPIREAIEDVEFTLMLSIGLVILVIFIFLKRLSATIIPTLALPVSLIGTFAFMQLLGYSLDNISLLALTLAVGFVVDDAIVMLENIVRHIENGMKPFEAALRGSREIGFTIISITFSLIAVFIPVFFMGGVVGRVFREFAATISISILVSGFVSLTLTPMLCARFLKSHNPHEKPALYARLIDLVLDAIAWGYRVSLDLVLKFRFLFLLVTIAMAAITVQLYKDVPKGFFPIEDTGLLRGVTEGPPDTSFDAMVARQQRILQIVATDPAVNYVTANVGFGGGNQGFLFIALKPRAERDSAQAVVARLRAATSQVPGIRFISSPVQNLNLNAGRSSRALYQYTIAGPELAPLIDVAPRILSRLERLPQLRDVSLDLQLANPEIVVNIDREKAAQLGVSPEAIRNTLYNAFGQRQIATIFKASGDYQVIMEADRKFQNSPDALSRLFVRGGNNTNVPLDVLVTIERKLGPLAVTRVAQMPAVTLSFNTAPEVALGDAVAAIKAAESDIGLPTGVTTSFAGSAQLFQEAQAGQGLLLLAAVLVIYILLGVLYESFIHPITILSGLPSAGLGALIALQHYKMDLSVIAMIGILMLIGIVKKNAIMMVDFAIERRREGIDAPTAIREAAIIRFRPIMMTTMAALLGVLPIAIGHGAGSELRQPLGIAVVGGLVVSQFLTLYITPVVYIYLDKVDSFFSGRRPSGDGGVRVQPAE